MTQAATVLPGISGEDVKKTGKVSNINNPSKGTTKPGSILADAQDDIWQNFLDSGMPLMLDLQKNMGTRVKDWREDAREGAIESQEMVENQKALMEESLGVSSTGRGRGASLATTEAIGSAENAATDAANAQNLADAQTIASVQTMLANQGIGDLSSASGLQNNREVGNVNAAAAADSQNMQMAGTALMMAAMFM